MLNALARGRLPSASAQLLLQQNLELLSSQNLSAWPPRDVALLCSALHQPFDM